MTVDGHKMRPMKRTGGTAALALAGIVALTGCGGASTATHAVHHTAKVAVVTHTASTRPTRQVAKPTNPVTLLRKIKGCKIDPSEHVGTVEMDTGGMTASCSFPGEDGSGNDVYMHTFTTAGQLQTLTAKYPADDSVEIVVGNGFMARLVGTMNYSNGYDFNVKAVTLAHELGGHVVTP